MNSRQRVLARFLCIMAFLLTIATVRADDIDFGKASLDETVKWLKSAICNSAAEQSADGQVARYIDVLHDGSVLRIVRESVQITPRLRIVTHTALDSPLDQLSTEQLLLNDGNGNSALCFRVTDGANKIRQTDINDSAGTPATVHYINGFLVNFNRNKDTASNAAKALKHAIELCRKQ